jgi:hypothetical protein
VILSETGHFKEDRSKWIQQITEDCIKAMEGGVDLRGICIYPVLDRPDWDEQHYISCGIWGYDTATGERTVEADYLACVQQCHEKIQQYLKQKQMPVIKRKVTRQKSISTF